MKKICFLFIITMFMLTSLLSLPVLSATYDIYVTPENDFVYGKSRWGYSKWEYFKPIISANPNEVSHWYQSGDGQYKNTSFIFNIFDIFTESISDINSVTFNYNVLSILWNDGGKIGNLQGNGANGDVLESNGTGWQSFDITSVWKSMTTVPNIISYDLVPDSYSGFTVGSAEGGDPAFLRIITSNNINPVPSPSTFILLGSGLIAFCGLYRKKE